MRKIKNISLQCDISVFELTELGKVRN